MQKMLFVAVLLCDFYANCVDIMQIVLFLCKLWGFYANYDIYHNLHCFVANDIFVAEIRALAGTFGPAIRRLLLLMMSGPHGVPDPPSLAQMTFTQCTSMSELKIDPGAPPGGQI